MNIQIDNPVAVLNQDISRTFLVSSKSEEKYELFMKATFLDIIGNNYKEANLTCQEEYGKLQQYNEVCFYYTIGNNYFILNTLITILYRLCLRQETKWSNLNKI